MRLAILLITCDRAELTSRTLESFVQHNGSRPLTPWDTVYLHGDDNSLRRDNCELAARWGFETVIVTRNKQLGAHRMRRKMIEHAMTLGVTHILVLENDWESVAPLPWPAITEIFSREDVYCFRLYGVQKQADGTRPAGPFHAGRRKADPQWQDHTFGGLRCQLGDIHWGAPPAVVVADKLLWLHQGTTSDSQSMRKSGEIQEKTVRVYDNIFWHIGVERTPRFRK